jgi:hypothetical protein
VFTAAFSPLMAAALLLMLALGAFFGAPNKRIRVLMMGVLTFATGFAVKVIVDTMNTSNTGLPGALAMLLLYLTPMIFFGILVRRAKKRALRRTTATPTRRESLGKRIAKMARTGMKKASAWFDDEDEMAAPAHVAPPVVSNTSALQGMLGNQPAAPQTLDEFIDNISDEDWDKIVLATSGVSVIQTYRGSPSMFAELFWNWAQDQGDPSLALPAALEKAQGLIDQDEEARRRQAVTPPTATSGSEARRSVAPRPTRRPGTRREGGPRHPRRPNTGTNPTNPAADGGQPTS